MPRAKPDSYETRLTDMVADAIMEDGDRMAAESGPPPGRRNSEADEAFLWGRRDPNVQYEATLQTMQTTGFGEMAEQLVVVQENPELLDAYANPAPDPETAHALAVLAEYPFRASIWIGLGDPDDRVAAANRAAKAWEKRQMVPMPMIEGTPTAPMPQVESGGHPVPMPTYPPAPPPTPGVSVPPELPATPPDPALTVGG